MDIYEKQLGTAVYLIDFLALRVGGEKDADEADTVGCCSLRVEHIKFSEKKQNTITLDFLGKDSIRYFNTVTVSLSLPIPPLYYYHYTITISSITIIYNIILILFILF